MDITNPKFSEELGQMLGMVADRREELIALARKAPNMQALRTDPKLKDLLSNNSMQRARRGEATPATSKPATSKSATGIKKSLKR